MILLAEMKHIQRLDAMEIQKSSSVKGALRPLTREPRSNRIEQILLAENDKQDPWPLDTSSSPKGGKSRLNLHGTILEGKSIDSDPKKEKSSDESS